jgi:hypothetical protein
MTSDRVGTVKREKRPRTVRIKRWLYRISATRRWNPIHPSQRFNFPRDNSRTTYLGQALGVCRAEVFGRRTGLVPKRLWWVKARVNVALWDLRKPERELGKALGRLVGRSTHAWAVRSLATRARRMGIQGILYWSVRDPRKWCAVLFQENVEPREIKKAKWIVLP